MPSNYSQDQMASLIIEDLMHRSGLAECARVSERDLQVIHALLTGSSRSDVARDQGIHQERVRQIMTSVISRMAAIVRQLITEVKHPSDKHLVCEALLVAALSELRSTPTFTPLSPAHPESRKGQRSPAVPAHH